MRMKAFVAVALAVWMTWAAFPPLPATAAPSHTVGGGVFGPGGSVAAGPANAANNATGNANPYSVFAFYSTNQPTFPVQTCIWNPPANTACTNGVGGFSPADGTNPTFFLRDVGSDPNWNWNNGDTVVAVVETIRGVNGWAGVNYTTSLDAAMSTVNGTTDLGDGTLEQIPALTISSSGPGYVDLQWTPLADAQGNLVSYRVYRAPTAYGGYVPVGVTPQGATPRSFNNTGLAAGTYCYELAVQYLRDMAGGTYETTGRSEPSPGLCRTVAATPPTITSTVPVNGATGVVLTQDIIVNFSKSMNTASLTFPPSTVNPDPGGLATAWSNLDMTATITHNAFAQCTSYTVTVTGAQDTGGVPLAAGSVPNPWTFSTVCANPQVVLTSPVNDATGVRRSSNVVITFSKAMNQATVGVAFSRPAGSPTCVWTSGDTVCTLAVLLLESTWYYVNVTGNDAGGLPLVPGPVPYNPFRFKSNDLPIVNIQSPSTPGLCVSGATVLTIGWTMSDAETATASLQTYINYTKPPPDTTIYPITPGPLTNQPSPDTYPWSTPSSQGDFDAVIWMEVVDAAGERGTQSSATVRIDATAPTLSSTTPANTTQNVATDAAVQVVFSEAMDTAVTGTSSVISFTPVVTGLTYTWSNGDKTVTVGHNPFASATDYQLIITASAKDACTPGKTLSADEIILFTTGQGVRKPGAPKSVQASSASPTTVQLTWLANTSWTDGSSLPESSIQYYLVYRSSSQTGAKQQVGNVTVKTFTDTDLASDTTYYYWVTEFAGGIESDYSATVPGKTTVSPGGDWWLYLLIIIIVVVLLLVGFMLLRRRGPEAGAPKEAKPSEAPPEEGTTEVEKAPAESGEETSSEGGEKFIPCPNCGTMVKPTDAECFVCGAKL